MNYMNLIASGMFGAGNMPMSLNEMPIVPQYAWYDKLTGAQELPTGKYLAFDRMRSSCINFQRGNDQDEMKQDPATRSVSRYLNTNYVIYVPEPNGIWALSGIVNCGSAPRRAVWCAVPINYCTMSMG